MSKVHGDVQDMFVDSFTSATKKLIGVSLVYDEKVCELQSVQNIKIQSKGTFQASLFFAMDKEFEQTVFLAMGTKFSVGEELRQLLLGEFINVISGHALTSINNMTGKISRLSIPVVGISSWEDANRYANQCSLSFQSKNGKMRMDMSYEFV